jgi:hypothetical protein
MAQNLAVGLLEQAEVLRTLDATRPKQVNLRRGVSAAYYAVFHLLVREAADRVVGAASDPSSNALRAQVVRWYSHETMKRVCGWFGSLGPPPREVADLLGYPRPGRVPAALLRLSDAFFRLQEARHQADYDPELLVTRSEVALFVDMARAAFDDAKSLANDPVYALFLTMLLTGDRFVRTR